MGARLRRGDAALWLLLVAGCAAVHIETGVPPTAPARRYETPREVTAGVPREHAREMLSRVLGRAIAPGGGPLRFAVGETRFSFAWGMKVQAVPGSMGHTEEHAFDFGYDEVKPVVVDLTAIGAREGVKMRRGGADVPYAYFLTQTLEDAETVCDALAVLARPPGAP